MSDSSWYPEKTDIQTIFKRGIWIVIGVLVFIILSTFLYMVGTDEQGVVLRFGRFVRVAEPGLHAKMPFGIEVVKTPKVKRIFKEEFGFRTLGAGVSTVYSAEKMEKESLMLCGDLNVAEVSWIVQYKIRDAMKYLFDIRNQKKIIRDGAEAVMRQVVGDSSVDEVLTARRIELNIEAQDKLQKVLDAYGSGLQIVTVKLQDVNPPEEVKPAFNEVNAAQQDKKKYVNQALEEYNKVIPRAKGEGKMMIGQAEAYAVDRVNRAEGESEKFLRVWREYKNASDVTMRRLYLEAISETLPNIQRVFIIDEEVKSVLPLLQLEEGLK